MPEATSATTTTAPAAAPAAGAEGTQTATEVATTSGGAAATEAKPATAAAAAVEKVTPKEVLEFRENQRRIGELQRKVEADDASLKELRELKARLDAVGDDHLARAQVLGLDLDAAVESYAKRGPMDPELLKQRQELAAIKQKQEAAEKRAGEEQAQRVRVQVNQMVQEEHGKIKALLDGSGEKFELARTFAQPADVWRVADQAVRAGAPMPTTPAEWQALYENAAGTIERHYEDKLAKGKDLKKVTALLAKLTATATPAADKTEKGAAAKVEAAKPAKTGRKLTRKEEEALLIREIEAEMKKKAPAA